MKYTITKTKLSGSDADQLNRQVAESIRQEIIGGHSKILVVTLKDNVEDLTNDLRQEVNDGKVIIAYDGNLPGNNAYRVVVY